MCSRSLAGANDTEISEVGEVPTAPDRREPRRKERARARPNHHAVNRRTDRLPHEAHAKGMPQEWVKTRYRARREGTGAGKQGPGPCCVDPEAVPSERAPRAVAVDPAADRQVRRGGALTGSEAPAGCAGSDPLREYAAAARLTKKHA